MGAGKLTAMYRVGLAFAVTALLMAALPGVAPFVGLAMAMFATAVAWLGYRRRTD